MNAELLQLTRKMESILNSLAYAAPERRPELRAKLDALREKMRVAERGRR